MAYPGLSPRDLWRLTPLRRRVRAGQLGGPFDGDGGQAAFVKWRYEHGEMSEFPMDDEAAARVRAGIMKRIRDDAEV